MTVAHCHSLGTHGTEFSLSRAASRGRCSWSRPSLCSVTESTDTRTHGHTDTHTHTHTHIHTTPHHNTAQHNTNQSLHHSLSLVNPFPPLPLLLSLSLHFLLPRFLPPLIRLFVHTRMLGRLMWSSAFAPGVLSQNHGDCGNSA